MIPAQLLDAFMNSVGSMPKMHVYGILAGTLVFLVTISTVAYLAVKGGVFERLYKQEVLKEKPEHRNVKAPANRPTLLDELQESRRIMMEMAMVKKVPLPVKLGATDPSPSIYKSSYAIFTQNFGPSSPLVPGKPLAAVESYSRGVSSQMTFDPPTSALLEYARSYGGVYWSVAAADVKASEKYEGLWESRRDALVGSVVHLVPAMGDRKLAEAFIRATSGAPFDGGGSYDAERKIWGFVKEDCSTPDSTLFGSSPSSGSLFVVDSKTGNVVGLLRFQDDCPEHLTITLSHVIFSPKYAKGPHETEALFMAMAKLFALGYRRIAHYCDDGDFEGKKAAER